MITMNRTIILLIAFALGPSLYATHIIGGVLNYEHQGNNDYLITLKLYRDCGPANTNGTGFDPSVTVAFYDQNNALFTDITMQPPAIAAVPVIQTNPCLTPPPLCVEEGVYTGVINVSVPPGGLTLVYQRCCRNPTVLNIGPQQGLTAAAYMPDGAQFPGNSSPAFIDFPPIAICVNDTLSFDHSATDPDGDQLVYSLCAPFEGGSPANPAPVIAPPPPYNDVTWNAGYSGGAPLDGSIAIDPVTGVLSAFPTLQGQYVVGVCVQEFRNGILLGETKRDFQFNVTACIANTFSAVQSQQTFCNGTTVNFINLSNSAADYLWDFGVTNLTSDTSTQFQPTYTYPDTGSYTVTLITNPGWPCSDTSTSNFDLYNAISASVTAPGITCFDDQPLALQVSGGFTAAAQVDWDLGPNAVNQFVSGSVISEDWLNAGAYEVSVTISENGCTSTFTDSVYIESNPIADFSWDPQGCMPFTSNFIDNSSADSPLNYLWDFGDGNTSTSATSQSHLYQNSGEYDVSLTVWTSSGCVDTSTMFVPDAILVQEIPTAFFTYTPLEVNVLDPLITVTDGSVDAINWVYTINGITYTTPDFSHLFNGGGYFTIVQTVSNDVGCENTYTAVVPVRDHLFYAPNAFTPNGDGVNDVWLPSAQGALEYQLLIYDRWGTEIFSTTDEFLPWKGENAQNGVYQYRVRIRSAGGFAQEYAGHFSLIR